MGRMFDFLGRPVRTFISPPKLSTNSCNNSYGDTAQAA